MLILWALLESEKGGFEPPRRFHDLPAFQASLFSHLSTSPIFAMAQMGAKVIIIDGAENVKR